MEALWQDLRLGLRVLAQKPVFTAVAVLTLALGIGANAAIFSVVNAVLLKPLPFENPDELVLVWETHHGKGLPLMYASPPNYADWRSRNQVFDDVAVFRPRKYCPGAFSDALSGDAASASRPRIRRRSP